MKINVKKTKAMKISENEKDEDNDRWASR